MTKYLRQGGVRQQVAVLSSFVLVLKKPSLQSFGVRVLEIGIIAHIRQLIHAADHLGSQQAEAEDPLKGPGNL